jgi:uncharacterized radical SAM superfamily Fe-S cluster-containing enzyme
MGLCGGETAACAPIMERKAAPYLFHSQTTSLCETCLEPVPAKVIIEGENVYYLKRCRTHGVMKTLVSDDLAYWQAQKLWLKPGTAPDGTDPTEAGCPFDCGLCPDHEQHSCLAIIEVTEACDLACPVCFADAADRNGRHRPLAEIEAMLDVLVESEGEPDLVQISGGEPTLHPEFFAILDAVKRRPIRHVMINTNGVRSRRTRRSSPGSPPMPRARSLSAIRRPARRGAAGSSRRAAAHPPEALEALEAGISTTLVVAVKHGVNDDEIAPIIQHALTWRLCAG